MSERDLVEMWALTTQMYQGRRIARNGSFLALPVDVAQLEDRGLAVRSPDGKEPSPAIVAEAMERRDRYERRDLKAKQ